MSRLVGFCVFMLLLLFAVSQVFAGYEEDKPSRLAFSVGLFRPSGGSLRDKGDNIWKSFAFEYYPRLDSAGRPVSALTLVRSSNRDGRFRGDSTSLEYSVLKVKKPEEGRGSTFGFGAGLYRLSDNLAESFPLPSEKHSGTKLGVSVMYKRDLSENWFFTVRYCRVGKLDNGSDFSGLSLCIGTSRIF